MTRDKFLLVHCDQCGVTSPREPAELARPSGSYCLICGAEFEQYTESLDEQEQQ